MNTNKRTNKMENVNLNLKKINWTREVIIYKGIPITLTISNTITLRAEFTIDGVYHKTAGEITAKTKIDKLLES